MLLATNHLGRFGFKLCPLLAKSEGQCLDLQRWVVRDVWVTIDTAGCRECECEWVCGGGVVVVGLLLASQGRGAVPGPAEVGGAGWGKGVSAATAIATAL